MRARVSTMLQVMPSFETRYAITCWLVGTRNTNNSAAPAPNLGDARVTGDAAAPKRVDPASVPVDVTAATTSPLNADFSAGGPAASAAAAAAAAAAATAAPAPAAATEAAARQLLLATDVAHAVVPRTPPTIFVSIPSFRDPECQRTIRDLFEKAARPERVHVGLCAQYDAGEDVQRCFNEPIPRPSQVGGCVCGSRLCVHVCARAWRT